MTSPAAVRSTKNNVTARVIATPPTNFFAKVVLLFLFARIFIIYPLFYLNFELTFGIIVICKNTGLLLTAVR